MFGRNFVCAAYRRWLQLDQDNGERTYFNGKPARHCGAGQSRRMNSIDNDGTHSSFMRQSELTISSPVLTRK